jgi:hypothetical protein
MQRTSRLRPRKGLQLRAFREAAEGIRTLDLLHGKQNVLRRFPRNIPANRKGFRDGCADRLPRDLPGVHGGLGSEWVVSNRDSGRPHRPGAMACLPCLAAAPRHAAAGRSPWRPATPGTPTRLVCSSGRDPGEESGGAEQPGGDDLLGAEADGELWRFDRARCWSARLAGSQDRAAEVSVRAAARSEAERRISPGGRPQTRLKALANANSLS